MRTQKDILTERVYEMYCEETSNPLSFDDYFMKTVSDQAYARNFDRLWALALKNYHIEITKKLNDNNKY